MHPLIESGDQEWPLVGVSGVGHLHKSSARHIQASGVQRGEEKHSKTGDLGIDSLGQSASDSRNTTLTISGISMTNLIDISPPVNIHSIVWPGDSPFQMTTQWNITAGDSVTVGTVTTTTHIGSHIDAPSHVVQGAADVSQVPLESCIGQCVVIDVSDLIDRTRSPFGAAAAEHIQAKVLQFTHEPIERLLLKHLNTGPSEWNPDAPGIDVSVMRWFANQGGKLMGIDLFSFDAADSTELLCHREAIEAGVVLLEGLDLSRAPEGPAELIALPLSWEGADASPVRAVLRHE